MASRPNAPCAVGHRLLYNREGTELVEGQPIKRAPTTSPFPWARQPAFTAVRLRDSPGLVQHNKQPSLETLTLGTNATHSCLTTTGNGSNRNSKDSSLSLEEQCFEGGHHT